MKIIILLFGAIFLVCIAAGIYLYPSYSSYNNNFDVEDVTFTSHEARLAGTLIIPTHRQVIASIAIVHGSGESKRNVGLATYFAAKGIATLVYDKRGVGDSEGIYVGIEGNVSEENLQLLSDDATAAIDFVDHHPALSSLPKGMIGFSQAGWIIPLAATKAEAVEFIGLWSGPVCKVSEEVIYSRFTGDGDAMETLTEYEKIKEASQGTYSWPESWGKDIDPVESLQSLSIPGLWIFGEKDASIPVDLSVSRLDSLIDSGKIDYEYVVKKGLGHDSVTDSTLSHMADWITQVSSHDNQL